jgi:hypothetical protein
MVVKRETEFLHRSQMVIELSTCNACGRKNAPTRQTCLSCGATLRLLRYEETAGVEVASSAESTAWIKRYTPHWNPIRSMQAAVIFSIALVAVSIAYYFFVLLPRQNEARTKLETAKVLMQAMDAQNKQEEKIKLDECLAEAYQNYTVNWANQAQIESTARAVDIRQRGLSAAIDCVSMGLDRNVCRTIWEVSQRNSAATANNYDISGPLPAAAATRINNDFYRDKDVCFKRYPQH